MTTDLTSAPPAASSEPPQWPALQSGETVDITITGAKVAYVDKKGRPQFAFNRPSPEEEWPQFPAAERVSITRSLPVDGEPRPGDVWTDRDGERLFAWERHPKDAGGVWLMSAGGRSLHWRDWHRGETGPIELYERPKPSAAVAAAAALAPDAPDAEA